MSAQSRAAFGCPSATGRVFSLHAFRSPMRQPVPMSPAAAERRALAIRDNFYPTPPEATRALLSVETFDGPIWEPACGEGHIAKVLAEAGHTVVSTDLNDRGFGVANVDFLAEPAARGKHIVTNPPYGKGLADAFVMQALRFCRETSGTVAMLLNLASLCHVSRTAWWRQYPPARLYAIDGVLCWPEPDRVPPRHFAANRYCWAVWTPNYRGRSQFWWLSAAEFRDGKLAPRPAAPTKTVDFTWLASPRS